jgi:hypothetical protein
MTMNMPPGFLPMGQRAPLHLRLGFYGFPKQGKTWLGMTFPAPLLLNPAAEGGYDTALHPDGMYIVQAVKLGATHAAFLRGVPGSVSISKEIDQWLEYLYQLVVTGKCPWQTIVMGGFSDVASMILEEAEKNNVNRKGEVDGHKAWGDVLTWYQKTLHLLFSLPLHVIVELGVKVQMDKDNRDLMAKIEPDLSGRGGRLVLPRELHALIFVEKQGVGTYLTHFQPRVSKPVFYAAVRLNSIAFSQPVQDCSYDTFAQALGLPPIWVCDPGHPRCQQGRWPWRTPWHV